MKKNEEGKRDKKRMIRHLMICVVAILIAVSYFPVKIAVYADENDGRTNSKLGVFAWFGKVWDDHMHCIIETSDLVDRPKLKASGRRYRGDIENPPGGAYLDAQGLVFQGIEFPGTSPLLKLNSSFDPCKVKNYFAITYEDFYEDGLGEMKEGHYELPIIIYQWTPVYPIQRSGTLASVLLPKGYLTIWDFIG